MEIALVIEHFDPLRGGAEQWTVQLSEHLLEHGHRVHVLARSFAENTASMPLVRHRVGCGGGQLHFARAVEARLQQLPVDLVHDMGSGWRCDVFQPHGGSRRALAEHRLGALPAWFRPLKRLSWRVLPRYRRFERLMARQYRNRRAMFVAMSQQTARDFRRFHRVPAERIRVVYNGVDTTRFSPARQSSHRQAVRGLLGVDERTLVLLIVAHHFAFKGVPAAVAATGRLARQGRPVHLVVVGGKHLQRWQHRAARVAPAGAVTFTGTVADPAPYYAAADVYVHPTFHDACSLVVLEAAACGLPVITTRRNGAAELLHEGKEGFILSDPRDVGELTERIDRLFDRRIRRCMGEAARQLACRHTFRNNAQQIVALYEQIAAERHARAAPATTQPAGTAACAEQDGDSHSFPATDRREPARTYTTYTP